MLRCERPYVFRYDRDKHDEKTKKYDGIYLRCGKCISCVLQKGKDWRDRIVLEAKGIGYSNCTFCTLTFSDDALYKRGSRKLDKRDCQLFIKRLRILASRRGLASSVRYYICGEYGDKTFRPHYHAILFGLSPNDSTHELLRVAWNQGFVHIGAVTAKSAAYVAGYTCKSEISSLYIRKKSSAPEFHLQSLGLGKAFVIQVAKASEGLSDIIRVLVVDGKKIKTPSYIVRKARELIYSQDYILKLKEALFLNYMQAFDNFIGDYDRLSVLWRMEAYMAAVKGYIQNLKNRYQFYYLRRKNEKIQI